MKTGSSFCGVITCIALSVSTGGQATKTENVTYTFIAEIVVAPCRINGNKSINIDFGELPVSDVVAGRINRKKEISVSCSFFQGTPFIKVNGAQLAGAADNVLQTNITSFGVALYQGEGTSTPLHLNGTGNGYPVYTGLSDPNRAESNFTFTAIPYWSGNGELPTGTFIGTATMNIIYL
ncbi:fimbrial protein [Salmonella enterica]|nr:fimbrial protein [Salmonella enterica]EAY0055003.1 fimbrial protein [Salmonella enterica]EHF1887922.1 fimbrial protein [Salmonella enterica]EHF3221228.1 fimbrial protein [Salmonella enterica subsp. houtenae serovar Houten]